MPIYFFTCISTIFAFSKVIWTS